MDRTTDNTICATCKHGMCMHKRYYTYDNRMVDRYEWGCTKGARVWKNSDNFDICGEWEKTVNI